MMEFKKFKAYIYTDNAKHVIRDIEDTGLNMANQQLLDRIQECDDVFLLTSEGAVRVDEITHWELVAI